MSSTLVTLSPKMQIAYQQNLAEVWNEQKKKSCRGITLFYVVNNYIFICITATFLLLVCQMQMFSTLHPLSVFTAMKKITSCFTVPPTIRVIITFSAEKREAWSGGNRFALSRLLLATVVLVDSFLTNELLIKPSASFDTAIVTALINEVCRWLLQVQCAIRCHFLVQLRH